MKSKKTMVAFFVMLMLAIPGFAAAGAVPDTGQTTCYDDQGNEKKPCPGKCATKDANGDPIGCERIFAVQKEVNGKLNTYSKFYFKDTDDTFKQFFYFGDRRCLDNGGNETACDPCECYDKATGGVKIGCPTTCYADNKGEIEVPCPAGIFNPSDDPAGISVIRGTASDDFYGQDSNYSVNTPSYTKLDPQGNELPDSDSEWAMVKDDVTGLIWEVKEAGGTDLSKPHRTSNMYVWDDDENVNNTTASFIKRLDDVKFGGYNGWRLPTPQEMSSILNYAETSPSINSTYFPDMQSAHYWTNAKSATHAYYVSLGLSFKLTQQALE